MVDIFGEVDEALRKERVEKLWRDYGSALIGGVVLLVVFTAVFAFMRGHTLRQNEAATAALIATLEQDPSPQALQAFAAETRTGHEAVSLLIAAQALSDEGRFSEAGQVYETIAKTGHLPALWRDLARLGHAGAMLPDASLVTEEESAARLKDLAALRSDSRSPWRWHAALVSAQIHAEIQHDFPSALSVLEGLVAGEESIPETLRERARILKHIYEIDGVSNQSGG